MIPMNPHMTVQEAREIIGPVWDGMSDAQLEGIIKLFSMFSKLAISQHIANKKKLVNQASELIKTN